MITTKQTDLGTMQINTEKSMCHHVQQRPSPLVLQWKFPFTNSTHEQAKFACWEESITHTQNKQAAQDRGLLPRSSCTNYGPLRDVLVRRTSRLKYITLNQVCSTLYL